jgi:outer membrane lipoprotein-sorting protein
MKSLAVCALLVLALAVPAFSQEFTTAQVLAKLDEKAKVFTSTQASIKKTGVNFGVNGPEESGKLSILMAGDTPRIIYDITEPKEARKKLILDKGWGTMYTVSTNTYKRQKFDAKSEWLQFVLLGFGTRAATIEKGYKAEAKGARQTIGGVQAIVLELTSIAESTSEFPKVTLWLNPQTWTPVQLRLAKSDKKYDDYTYSNVQLNRSVSDSVFELPKGAKEQ